MSRKCQVTRNGEVIGKHDEPTMLALLNAGALRLSDSYWHPGMDEPVTLADYLCRVDRRSWLKPPRVWLLLSVPCAVIAAALIMAAKTPHTSSKAAPVHRVVSPPAEEQPEIRRAIPIIRGRFEASARDDGIDYPQHTVERLATHSRVAVLAFDDKQQPLGLASGIVVGDGYQVLTATDAVAGASRVEIHLANGDIVVPKAALIDEEVTVFTLTRTAVPVRWADEPIITGTAVALLNHPLGEAPGSAVQRVQTIVAGSQRVHYELDSVFAPSTAGSAMLNAAGELVGILVDPANGRVLRAADARLLLQQGKAGPVSALAARQRSAIEWPLTVSEAEIHDGQAVVTLRNQCSETLNRVVLHLRSYALPPESDEVRQLEDKLRYAAVQSGQSDADNTPEALASRQVLREVTTRLESARQRLKSALAAAREKPLRSEVQIIECDLAPGSVQRVILEVNAASNWGVDAFVLEAVL